MLVLASQSPRRREILERAGIPFIVRVSPVEEIRAPGEHARDYVERLALAKAHAVACHADEVVLGADTTVVVDGDVVLEKPVDHADAARMIRLLSGRSHQVFTGICLRTSGRFMIDLEETRVHFVVMSDREIADYVASGEPMDKAGAYGIQGRASKFIDRVEGCYLNVMGLPMSLVYRRLKDLVD